MQLQDRKYHSEYKNTKDVFVQLSRNGPKELYRGMTAVLMRNGPTSVTWFCGSDWIQANLPQTTPKLLGGFLSGALPAAVNATCKLRLEEDSTHSGQFSRSSGKNEDSRESTRVHLFTVLDHSYPGAS